MIALIQNPSPLGKLVRYTGGTFSEFRFDGAPEPASAHFPFIDTADVRDDDAVFELHVAIRKEVGYRPSFVKALAAEIVEENRVPVRRFEGCKFANRL